MVDHAPNGQIGLYMVRDSEIGTYDAVLMDIQMPVMNGYEATRQIRGMGGEYADLPIIAMSANAYEEDVKESIASGMNGHIAKPFDPRDLAIELRKRIHRQ